MDATLPVNLIAKTSRGAGVKTQSSHSPAANYRLTTVTVLQLTIQWVSEWVNTAHCLAAATASKDAITAWHEANRPAQPQPGTHQHRMLELEAPTTHAALAYAPRCPRSIFMRCFLFPRTPRRSGVSRFFLHTAVFVLLGGGGVNPPLFDDPHTGDLALAGTQASSCLQKSFTP